ncbi:MAG: DUF5615 family PIN-like protein [Candidatus Chisholmbacteria bacterium]|nr:DUF5615 family PIN-like protein [Candidatus Chisholmbacteria bacterium]
MKFLADENIGLEVVTFLRRRHHDVRSVIEDCPGASDAAILTRAAAAKRILITSDTDFGTLVYHARLAHAGIILLRLEDERNNNKIAVLKRLIQKYQQKLPGNFVVVTETSVRIRQPSNLVS